MAFQILAYSTTSDNNHVEKVFTYRATITGTLREPCSLLRPEIVIERQSSPVNWTHLRIHDFNRWYYINNIVSVGKNLWQLSCSVDVLETYHGSRDDETMLYGCTGIVARNEAASDPTLTDSAIPIQNNITMNLVSGVAATGNTWHSSDYVLSDLPGDTSTRYQIMYSLAGYNSSNVYVDECYPQSFVTLDLATYKKCVKFAIEQNTILMDKPITDYILKSYWLPFNAPKGTQKIKTMIVPGTAGDFSFDDPGAPILDTEIWSGEWTVTIPAITSYRYKNFAPFRDVFVEFLPFGRIKLDNAVIFSNTYTNPKVYFKVRCNPATGDAYLSYYTDDFPEQFLAQSNVAINLPFTSNMVNYGQIASSVASSIVSGVATIGSAASGNYAGALAAGASTIANIASMGNAGRSASVGAISGGYVAMRPNVYIYDNTTNANARNDNLLGMPLFESKKISNVYGYAEITNIHLEGFTATAQEKSELLSILAGGVVFDNAP